MPVEVVIITLLLIVYQIKHFVIDFLIQLSPRCGGHFMLQKFSDDPKKWVPALSLHCSHHAIATFLIIYSFVGWLFVYDLSAFFFAVLCGVIDFSCHFVMDRIKADKQFLGRYKYPNVGYFNALGFDQMIHHFTHYIIILLTLMYLSAL